MQHIKKHEIRTEYFDERLWDVAGITETEKEELQLLSVFRTSTADTFACSKRAYLVLKSAFGKIEEVIAKKGFEFDVIERLGHKDYLFARNKKTGKMMYRWPVREVIEEK